LKDSDLLVFTKNCSKLTHLNFRSCKGISEESINAILEKNKDTLTQVDLGYSKPDLNLTSLVHCPKLEVIHLERITNLSQELCKDIIRSSPALKELYLHECHTIDDECITLLVQSCPKIRRLECPACPKLTNESLKQAITSSLTEISIGNSNIDLPMALTTLKEAKQLLSLDLSGATSIREDQLIKPIIRPNHPSLERLVSPRGYVHYFTKSTKKTVNLTKQMVHVSVMAHINATDYVLDPPKPLSYKMNYNSVIVFQELNKPGCVNEMASSNNKTMLQLRYLSSIDCGLSLHDKGMGIYSMSFNGNSSTVVLTQYTQFNKYSAWDCALLKIPAPPSIVLEIGAGYNINLCTLFFLTVGHTIWRLWN